MDKILFIRRDNIGDLLCTTPAIRAARLKFKNAKIGVLVNSYNAEAISGNPDIDFTHIYTKEKHLPNETRLKVWLKNLKVFKEIRSVKYDAAIACGASSATLARYAFIAGARLKIGYAGPGWLNYYNSPVEFSCAGMHEVERTFNLLKPLGIEGGPGDMVLVPQDSQRGLFKGFMENSFKDPQRPLVSVLISARIKRHRWPVEKYMLLIEGMLNLSAANLVVLWAPGPADSAMFPGDDGLAGKILKRFEKNSDRVVGYPTPTLSCLIAAMSCAQITITPDTGSLHVSSALKKPTVALMTGANVGVWGPWRTEAAVLSSAGDVSEIEVNPVLSSALAFVERCENKGSLYGL